MKNQEQSQENRWYAKDLQTIFGVLNTSSLGLSQAEAQKRLDKYGPNSLPEPKTDSIFKIFLKQFQSPLIYVLLAAALIVFFLKEYTDAGIIFFVLLFNAGIGAYQEGRSRNTLLALRRFVETKARVLRAGREILIPDYQVVPGDILVLEQGDKIAADARIIESLGIKVDEAALTGESEPVEKIDTVLKEENLIPADQKNMLFKGTYAVSGSGRAVAVATGSETVIGRIAKQIAAIDTEIPLKKNIRQLSKIITIVVLLMVVMLFFYGLSLGKTTIEMFKLAVSLAVAVIPEGLPIVMTLVLATGGLRMSRRNALVKRLGAVESLGQTKVIAVDKTGTITKNEMTVEKVYINGKIFEISGAGYEPKGDIKFESKIIDPLSHPEIIFAGRISAFCSNANVFYDKENGLWRVAGDPTEAAMMVFAEKVGFQKNRLEEEFPKIAETPFDSKTKIHVMAHKIGSESLLTAVGAPETVLESSTKIWQEGSSVKITEEDKKQIEKVFDDLSGAGYRVLAMGTKQGATDKVNIMDTRDLVFVGFLAMRDPLRPEAREAILKARAAGVKIVMITGDHKKTAEVIARDAGIWKSGDSILTGLEIDAMSDNEFAYKISKTSVFARVTPEHKLRIIQAYKKRGEIIAMTGDGVNDAPPLAAADLGVAMGRIGTEVAKEASDIILLDDNLGSIVAAIEEGRSIYRTIKKVILFLFSTNLSEIAIIVLALFIGLPIPLLAAQILWINLVTDSFPVLALAMGPKERDLLTSKYKHSKSLIDRLLTTRMFIMALPMTVGTLFLFAVYLPNLTLAWTVALTAMVIFQLFNAFNCRHESDSIFNRNLFSNKYLNWALVLALGLQIIAVYAPFMQKIFHTTALGFSDWLYITAIASTVIVFEEIRKLIYND